ncbi:MAG: ASCH domain-containing protein, partial [Candidatus Xenobia bacterium]
MLFKVRFHPGILSGAIQVTFRAWEAPRVKVGGRYKFGLRHATNDYLVVDAVDVVAESRLRAADARDAGYESRQELLAHLRPYLRPGTRIYRVRFHYAEDQVDPRVALREELDDLRELLEKLKRRGPWVHETLTLLRDNPHVAASRLAPMVGR